MPDTNHPQPEDHTSLSAVAGAGSGQPRRRKRRWPVKPLVLAGLMAVVLAVVLARLGAAPVEPAGRSGATGPPPTSMTARPVGGLLYIGAGSRAGGAEVWVANPDGTGGRNLTSDPAHETAPDWSPDGTRIVYAAMPSRCHGPTCQADLYAIDRDGGRQVRLTRTPQDEATPDWSPDGTRIAYTRRDRDRSTIWVMSADGSGQRPLSADPAMDPDWAPDGRQLLYLHDGSGTQPLYTINADGSARRRLGKVNKVRTARWSPDGTRIALTAHDAIWILDADTGGLRRIRQSAAYPSWSPDGRHLVFIAYASAAAGQPELRRIDVDGRNEVVLRRDQADSAPKLR